jgi:hypothetical protein
MKTEGPPHESRSGPKEFDETQGDEAGGPVAGQSVEERQIQAVQQQKYPDTGDDEPGQKYRLGRRV